MPRRARKIPKKLIRQAQIRILRLRKRKALWRRRYSKRGWARDHEGLKRAEKRLKKAAAALRKLGGEMPAPRWRPVRLGGELPSLFSSPPEQPVDKSMLATSRLAGGCWKCGSPVYGDTGICSNANCMTREPDVG